MYTQGVWRGLEDHGLFYQAVLESIISYVMNACYGNLAVEKQALSSGTDCCRGYLNK